MVQDLRHPLERYLVALGPSATVVARVLRGLVGDASCRQVVTQQPVAPVEVVIVVRSGVEQDAGQLPEVVESVVDIDHRVEAQPAVPDVLKQLAAGPSNGQVDVEGWVIRIG